MVKIVRPDWVVHPDEKERSSQTIYTLDVHPDGERIATGSLDTKIKIWSTLPILDEAKEKDDSVHKCLATLTSHSGVVNHVRWSNSGQYLASASDDQVVMVWTKQAGSGGKAFGSTEENHENWFPFKRLVGHGADVTAIAWNHDDSYLASVALDGSVIVWNGFTFEIVRRLAGHDNFAKGVVWDPVGQYLATQADDNSMRIWRTDDWQLEADIKAPFVECPKPNLLRPSWSPEGTHIVAPNAMSGPIFVAAVIDRSKWTSNTSLVGHTDVVEVAAFHPKVFLRDATQPAAGANLCTVLALCSRSNLSIWITSKNSPLVIFNEVFDRDILDLTWSKDGKQLWCSSSEGHVAVFEFEPFELGNEAPPGSLEAFRKTYGFTPRAPLRPIAAPSVDHGRVGTLDNPNKLQVRKGPAVKRRIVPSAPAPLASSVPSIANAFQPPIQDALPARISTFMSEPPVASTSRLNGVAPLPVAGGWSGAIASPVAAQRKRKASAMIVDSDGDGDDEQGIDPFERVSAFPNRIKGRALGEGRPRKDMEIRTLKPAYVRDVDFAITNEREKTAQPALAVPAVKTFGSKRIVDGEQKDVLEYRNLTDGDLNGSAEVRVVAGTKTIWYDFVPKHVVVAAGSPSICAVSLEDSSLRVWSASSGRSVFPVVVLDSPGSFLEAEGHFLMAITALGTLSVWNVAQGKIVIGPIRVGPLLLSSATKATPVPTISTAGLLPNGTPVIALDSGATHSFDGALQAWTRLSELWWAKHSDQWEARRGRTNTVGRGVVRNIESGINDILVDAQGLDSTPPAAAATAAAAAAAMDTTTDDQRALTNGTGGAAVTTNGKAVEGEKQEPTHPDDAEMKLAVTLGHLETRMRAAIALDSQAEYRTFLLSYAKLIAEEGIRNKGEELVKELLGPIYFKPGAKEAESWSSTVVGLQKRDLLREVLNAFVKARLLAGLAQEYLDLLKKINAMSL